MNNRTYIFGGITLSLVLIALLYLFYASTKVPVALAPTLAELPPATTTEETLIEPPTSVTTENSDTLITVDTPQTGAVAKSPLTISGKARGNWYFEASFPIKLVDANGTTIAETKAQAAGDWMTEDFVPFTTTLTWAATSTSATSGMLILMRDNPSDIRANDASVEIPVFF